MTRSLRLACVLLGLLSVTGCGRLFKASCVRPGDFAGAVDNPPLKIPAGLDGPDTRSAVPIPPLAEPERPRKPDDPCLDAPPKYAIPKETRPAA